MRRRERYENSVFTIRFIGDAIDQHGVSIYDLACSLLEMQRLVNKAHLSAEGKLLRGAYPEKIARTQVSLTVGERRRGSDAFALIPLLADPATYHHLKALADYVVSGLVGYYVGDILDRVRKEPDEDKQQFIGAIHANVVNIVNRIDAAGGIEAIEIGSPVAPNPRLGKFEESNKNYINSLANEYYLGPTQTIEGDVYRMYPNSNIVTLRRSGRQKVNVFLSADQFEEIRYDRRAVVKAKFVGRPRYKFGIQSKVVTEFEAVRLEVIGDS